jgi:pSer/pThr/pTyr-binding forkhead associated (FHA) protein
VRALNERVLRQEPLDVKRVARTTAIHAVVIDTGTSFVLSDLRSANGVDIGGERIRSSVTLAHGDRIRICDHEFVFRDAEP